jgi:hypothetical protein
MKSGVVASVLLAVAIPNATAEDIAFHTEYVPQQLFDAKREAPVERRDESFASLCMRKTILRFTALKATLA